MNSAINSNYFPILSVIHCLYRTDYLIKFIYFYVIHSGSLFFPSLCVPLLRYVCLVHSFFPTVALVLANGLVRECLYSSVWTNYFFLLSPLHCSLMLSVDCLLRQNSIFLVWFDFFFEMVCFGSSFWELVCCCVPCFRTKCSSGFMRVVSLYFLMMMLPVWDWRKAPIFSFLCLQIKKECAHVAINFPIF